MARFLAGPLGTMLPRWRQAAQIRLLPCSPAGRLLLGGGDATSSPEPGNRPTHACRELKVAAVAIPPSPVSRWMRPAYFPTSSISHHGPLGKRMPQGG